MNPEIKGRSGSKGNLTETIEQRYIRLLRLLAETGEPMLTNPDEPPADLAAFAELLNAGFIDGNSTLDAVGKVRVIHNMTISVSGRTFLGQLESKAAEQTSVGLIKKHRFAFYKWFFAIFFGLVIGYLFRLLTE